MAIHHSPAVPRSQLTNKDVFIPRFCPTSSNGQGVQRKRRGCALCVCVCVCARAHVCLSTNLSTSTSTQTLYLDWKPLCRDAFVYSISIVLLVGFSWDGQLEWYEVTILLLFYIAYILLMKVNSFIMTLLDQLTCG